MKKIIAVLTVSLIIAAFGASSFGAVRTTNRTNYYANCGEQICIERGWHEGGVCPYYNDGTRANNQVRRTNGGARGYGYGYGCCAR